MAARMRLDWSLGVVAVAAAVLLTGVAAHSQGASSESDPASTPTRPAPHVGVVVRERSPASPLSERLVRGVGGKVTRRLPIVENRSGEGATFWIRVPK